MSQNIDDLSYNNENMISKLKTIRQNERERFLYALRNNTAIDRDLEDQTFFSELINLATSDYGVGQMELAARLGVTAAAVSRWKTGKNAPPTYGRIHIKAIVADLLEEALHNGDQLPPPIDDDIRKPAAVWRLRDAK